jgi:hypothetical protein
MTTNPPVGPSTVVLWITAALIAALAVLQDGGNWLLAVSAGLVAVNNGLRSWQAHEPEIYVVGESGDHDDVDELDLGL